MSELKNLPMNDERYRIPGTNAFNYSMWARENVEQPPPAFKVGDKVVFTIITEIEAINHDCDGSVLYTADMIGHGWGERNFRAFTEADQELDE